MAPLSQAALTGDTGNTRALLEAGAAVDLSRCSKLAVAWMETPIIELLAEHGLNLKAVDENGKNELHTALAPPGVPRPESVEFLLRAGVPVNARDHSGKTPFDYWREPRGYEVHWFATWLTGLLGDHMYLEQQRKRCAQITELLARWGAGG